MAIEAPGELIPAGSPPPVLILGGGGHARVLLEALGLMGFNRPLAVLDRRAETWGGLFHGLPVLGGDDLLPRLASLGCAQFLVGQGSVGDNRPRRRLFNLALEHGLTPLNVMHPLAYLAPSALAGPGAQLMAGAIVNTAARLGANVLVNCGAIVEHDCVVADHAHVASGARLSGGVQVGEAAHIGTGAVIKEWLCIGAGALVAAGAAVIAPVPAGALVAGVPARVVRQAAWPEPGGDGR